MRAPAPPLEIVILAAGQGRRMASALPKVLHTLAGRPLLAHVLDTASALAPRAIHVVYGHGGERVREAFAHARVNWVLQAEQRGTGDAVRCALAGLADDSVALVLLGDVPLISKDTLETLRARAVAGPALLTFEAHRENQYGRIVRDAQGRVVRIVEWRDADLAQRALREVNSGVLAAPVACLREWIPRLSSANAQGELYLTDVIALAVADGLPVATASPARSSEVEGVNSRADLAALERAFQEQQAAALMASGAQLMDPRRFDVRGTLITGRDVWIDVNCLFEGRVEIADDVRIGAHCIIRDSRIARGARIEPHTLIDGAEVGPGCVVGPFARLRPGAVLDDHARVGNFVEVKGARIGAGTKINHLSYIGDATIGQGVNIGAGVITCNYDGARKHRTTIGDHAFIGSDSQLVAPVEIGAGATIGAGSTITKDAPAGELTLSRAAQKTVSGWQRPSKPARADKE
ncbi:bifunctional UDP-N-acetylglucosamine diphosphorylase/glucosamine-1-phosphate N-acetyltransferase GlmU [Acidiferrobacter sp.]|uniref:bifunctional UDP-N-acetylglucosamine diphosphorylase/glucosamine-1-phosphate N-acetyltransferase GlmU n=1 Tax=Acidiferrobacter sp. TaxID=1872107 RepID=UPI002618CA74|nr:bifunctional UDP-N-acetylglucosamine diphosphorylase/glucosamine-1-phosphate N-acetyltransferase GlmU [Acidiferrobacter sp.]